MLQFDATTLGGYGNSANEDAIRFLGSGSYNEVKDCTFDHFYNTILDSTNAEIWVFETDISNAQRNGILVHGGVAGVTVKVAETDFISCNYGINLSKGSSATIQLAQVVTTMALQVILQFIINHLLSASPIFPLPTTHGTTPENTLRGLILPAPTGAMQMRLSKAMRV
jgi:hypothetical protein